jgi:type IV secretion system protein VirD4
MTTDGKLPGMVPPPFEGMAPPVAEARRGLYLGAGRFGPLIGHPEQGALVLGPPRSGKTSSLVIPNVLGAPGSVVSTSTKPDVLRATLRARWHAGRCWLYDPSGTVDLPPSVVPLRWSPVTAGGTWDGALLMARSMVRAARPAQGLVDPSPQNTERKGRLALA